MAASSEDVDPHGWSALSTLRLAVLISARDRVTGALIGQGRLVAALAHVLEKLTRDGGERVLERHLFVDLPVQHAQAYRTDDSTAEMETANLGMILVSLRPRPIAADPKDVLGQRRWIDLAARAFARAKPGDEDIQESIAADAEMSRSP